MAGFSPHLLATVVSFVGNFMTDDSGWQVDYYSLWNNLKETKRDRD